MIDLDQALHTNGDYYVAAIFPKTLIDTEIPEGIDPNGWDKKVITPAVYDDDGNETTPAVMGQKNVRRVLYVPLRLFGRRERLGAVKER